MGTTYGYQPLTPVVGNGLSVLANLDEVAWVPVGLTLDWATVDPVVDSDVDLLDGITVKVGYKALRYGQVLALITATGKYGPYNSGASDGRETLTRGQCFVLNQTVTEVAGLPGLPVGPTNHPGAFYAGLVWRARLLLSTDLNPFQAAGPTLADFNTAFPQITYIKQA